MVIKLMIQEIQFNSTNIYGQPTMCKVLGKCQLLGVKMPKAAGLDFSKSLDKASHNPVMDKVRRVSGTGAL